MKKRLLYTMLMLLFRFSPVAAHMPEQSMNGLIQNIHSSINALDTKEISTFFDNTVEFTYINTHSTLTRGHALLILNDFYEKHKPKSFKVDYTGSTPLGDGRYILGSALTESGTFKLYFYVKERSGKFFIEELKIVK